VENLILLVDVRRASTAGGTRFPRCKPDWARVSLRTILFLSTVIGAVATTAVPEPRPNWLICPWQWLISTTVPGQRSLSATVRRGLHITIMVVRWTYSYRWSDVLGITIDDGSVTIRKHYYQVIFVNEW